MTPRTAPDAGRLDASRRPLHIGELARLVEDHIRMAFPRRIWVTGRVSGSRLTGEGDRVFRLIEQRELHEELTLPCVLTAEAAIDIDGSLDRLHDAAIDDLLVDGHLLRAGGLLSYDFASHRLTFTVTALDPEATAGGLAEVRAATADTVRNEALTGRQRSLAVTSAPLHIAIVGPRGDPAVEDACQSLERSQFDVDLTVYEPVVRGNDAVDQLAAAVRRAGSSRHDLILLLRAGGRPLGLAAFDSQPVVRAVATSEVPILTGIGDAGHRTVSDVVAHQAHRTAPDAVDALLARLHRAASSLDIALTDVHREAEGGRRRATQLLVAASSEVHEAALRASLRAAEITRRRRRWLRVIGAVAVVGLVLAAVLTGVIWLVIPAVLVVAGVAAEQFISPWRQARRGGPPVADATFAQVLDRLARIRGQLESTSSPEEVLRLEEEAEALAQHGREVLERRPGHRGTQRSAPPSVQDGWPSRTPPAAPPAPPARRPVWPGDHADDRSSGAGAGGRAAQERTEAFPEPEAGEQPTEIVAREGEQPTQAIDLTGRQDEERPPVHQSEEQPTQILRSTE